MNRVKSSTTGRNNDPTQSPAEQIRYLKEKLIELHRKLMEQLDVTKEQEKRIVALTRMNQELQEAAQARNSNIEESLQVDGLRQKLKTQQIENKKLKEQLMFLAEKYQDLEQMMTRQKKSRNDVSPQKNKAQNESDIEKIKKLLNEAQHEKLTLKKHMIEAEKNLKQHTDINRSLTEQNKALQAKLFNLTLKSQSLQDELNQLKSIHRSKSISSKDTHKEVDKLKKQIEFLKQKLQIKNRTQNLQQNGSISQDIEESRTPRRMQGHKNFDQTQELIKRLEEAELMTRNKNAKSIKKLKKPESSLEEQQQGSNLRQLTFDQSSIEAIRRPFRQ